MFLPLLIPVFEPAGTPAAKVEEFRVGRQYVSAAMRGVHARGMARGGVAVYAGQSKGTQAMDKEQITVAPTGPSPERTTFSILLAVSFCHLLNDMMQALLPAIYPTLKIEYHLTFAQIGLITLAFQLTASLLQPAVGHFADSRPMPYSLPFGMVFTFAGLLILSIAGSYGVILLAAVIVGLGSSVFHPESSRVARMASGGRHGLAQAMFQVGGNIGSALGPLTAAFIVLAYGQRSIAWYSLVALLAIFILWNVGAWYKTHGLRRLKSAAHHYAQPKLPQRKIVISLAILLTLIFSKFFYLSSITSYYTFYLIHAFHLSVQHAQILLFVFLAAVPVGTLAGGPLGDHFGRKYVIWFSILGALPFTLALPYANLFWTVVLSVIVGLIISSAFSAIVVYGQELLQGRVGMVSGLFFGFSFGMGGLGAALLGKLADLTSIGFVFQVCAFLPVLGLLTAFLPNLEPARKRMKTV
jgi:MFS transporter, FSR family, fosmidomycin resistance protein